MVSAQGKAKKESFKPIKSAQLGSGGEDNESR